MKIRIYYEDTDVGGVVYHANYLKFCERARSEAFFQVGKSPETKDGHFLVKNMNLDYIEPALLGDLIEVKTELIGFKGASFSLTQTIFKENREIFKASMTIVFIENKRPKRIPLDLKEDLLQLF
ncbi:MAG: YbgC/FadM family acyl-CoA thioesterase [Campylobacterales bacterium]|nr:YbgC/FadM family acyl-CoA thioesterase [Campylobacterales bacterium]